LSGQISSPAHAHATGQLKAAYLFGGGNNHIFCLAGPRDGLPSISCPDGTALPLDCSADGGVDAGGSDGSDPDWLTTGDVDLSTDSHEQVAYGGDAEPSWPPVR